MATFQSFGTARASAILPAAGAYDTAPGTIASNEYKQISFLISYTRGGAAGAVSYKVEFSNTAFTNDWYQVSEFDPPAVVPGADSVIPDQKSEIRYVATGAALEQFMSPTFNVAAQFVRISMKESGNIGAPGTAVAQYYLRGDA